MATLVTTTGTLSGAFSNAPDGTVLTMATSCQSTLPKLQIHYTSNTVTATVIGATTTTLATPRPSPASTNQSVALTATVATNSNVAPAGTVAFSANGNTISDCTDQPVTASGSAGGTATCSTSFVASDSPESLTATLTPSSRSGLASSTSSVETLTVNKGYTTTNLAASDPGPMAGGSVTYTATVTPGLAGATKPSGTVAFLDEGNAISGCTAQPLTAGSSPATATCTVSYSGAGSHAITAAYGGDADFTDSSTPATLVTVTAPSPATTVSITGAPAVSASTSRATGVRTRQATLNGRVSTGGAAVTWKFEYGTTTVDSQATAVQTIAAGTYAAVPVSLVVKGLSPHVLYHCRLVVSTTGQRANGQDTTFTTSATGRLAGPAGRLTALGRTILVVEKCESGVLCRGRFSFTVAVRARKGKKLVTLRCAGADFRINGHHSAITWARLSLGCLRQLRAQPDHRLIVTYTSRSETGQVGQRRRITLMLP